MLRMGVAVVVILVVAGLFLFWQGAAVESSQSLSQESRIFLLEQQVANLEARLSVVDLACEQGQIAAFVTDGGAGPGSVTLSWHPTAVDAPNDIFTSLSGEAILQGCTLTASP